MATQRAKTAAPKAAPKKKAQPEPQLTIGAYAFFVSRGGRGKYRWYIRCKDKYLTGSQPNGYATEQAATEEGKWVFLSIASHDEIVQARKTLKEQVESARRDYDVACETAKESKDALDAVTTERDQLKKELEGLRKDFRELSSNMVQTKRDWDTAITSETRAKKRLRRFYFGTAIAVAAAVFWFLTR